CGWLSRPPPATRQSVTRSEGRALGRVFWAPPPTRHYPMLPVRAGRFLTVGDRHVAVVGAAFASSRDLDVGARLTLEGETYEIVGVLERTLTAPDRFVIVSIADARTQWVAKDPMLRTVLASGAVPMRAEDLNTG